MKWLTLGRKTLGFVDHVSDRIVRGWAWRPAQPRTRARIDVFWRNVYLGQTVTGLLRPDLVANNIGDGRHGFVFHLPDDVPDIGLDVSDLDVIVHGPRPHALRHANGSQTGRAVGRLYELKTFFQPSIESLQSQTDDVTSSQTNRRSRIDAVCASIADTASSAFVEHIAAKYQRAGPEDGDPAAFWQWYLGTYAMERGPYRAPLSREAIDVLMKVDANGQPFAAGLFRDGPVTIGLEACYRWAIEESRRLFVEDCLVPSDDVERLRNVPPAQLMSRFPLSTFMQMLRGRHMVLKRVAVTTEEDRKKLYALIMLLALRSPHYLAYMPSRWLHEVLTPAPKISPFERVLTNLFGDAEALDLSRYQARIEMAGFDIASQTFAGTRYRGHRVLGGSMIMTRPAPIDVQIIGPFRRQTGLGESCRRIAEALRMTRFSTNAVDYDRGRTRANPAPDKTLGPLRPARLNILHLNAEDIPEAYAYLADVFSESRIVAVPYWELNQTVAAHRLGLSTVDAVWAASHAMAEVFRPDAQSVTWIGMSHDTRPKPTREEGLALRTRYGVAPDSFAFLTTSDALSWVQRKNPLAVIEAFQSAFIADETVALIVKTHNLQGPLTKTQRDVWQRVDGLCKGDPRITRIDETFERQQQRALLAGCDAFVSLHRAEGLGLDLLDALYLGVPLVATAYSGNMDFCSDATAWPVEFDLQPVHPDDYGYVAPGHLWAEPRQLSAVAAMRGVYGDSDRRVARVERGQAFVRDTASPEVFAERLARCVGEAMA